MQPMSVTFDDRLARCPVTDDRGFGALRTARGCLPLVALDVDGRITGLDLALDVRQTFVNVTGQAIEATYIFPLPDRAAVRRFRMTVNDRIIDGELDERGRARATYDQAIADGRRAAIAEEDRPGVFTLRVGNLMPGEVARVELGLVGQLPVEDGEATFAFPLVVAPRYIPGLPLGGDQAGLGVVGDTDRTPDASRISPPVLLPGFASPVRLRFALSVDGGGLPIGAPRAGLHELGAEATAGGWQLWLRPGERLDRDVVVRWQLGDSRTRTSAVWAPDERGEGATVMVTLVPPVGSGAAARPRDVVFVLDRSGSMQGWKMVAARRAVARMVDTLGPRDRFNVLAFDDTIVAPPGFPPLAEATDRRRFEAIEFLAKVEARGGTELAAPLALAASSLRGQGEIDRVLVLITDGQVGNEDEILARLAPSLGSARIFTLGIDQAVNAAFLRRLAATGGGACELVESEDRLDEVMGKVHRRIATPIVTDLTIDGVDLDPRSVAPARLPSLFAGAPVVALARCLVRPRPGSVVTLRGRLPGGTPFVETVALDSGRPGSAIEASWARLRVRDLEDAYVAGHGDRESMERSIVEVSLRHRVLSRFTAFVAVDRSEIANRGPAPRPIVQPVESPAGWGGPSAPAPYRGGGLPAMPPSLSMAPPPGMPGASPAMPSSAPMAPPPASRSRAGMRTQAGMVSKEEMEELDRATRSTQRFDLADASVDDESAPPPAAHAPPPPADQRRPAPAPAPRSAPAKASLARRVAGLFGGRAEAEGAASTPAQAPVGDELAPYRARLATLVDELTRAAAAVDVAQAAQLPVARLAELVEDLESIGTPDAAALAHQLAPVVARLRQALAAATLASELSRAVAELRALPAAPPPPTPSPASRRPFWK